MKPEKTVEELLRWRLEQARMDAPSAPSVSQLLELARPWWEKWPEKFQAQVERLRRIDRRNNGCVVPALIVFGTEESEGLARVLEFDVRNDHLHFRFQLEPSLMHVASALEVTFVSDPGARPLFSAEATTLGESECLLEAALLPEIARDWAHLKATDRLPFRLILRYGSEA
jgi:hypothetical protein